MHVCMFTYRQVYTYIDIFIDRYICISKALPEAVLLTLVSHPRALWANVAAVGGHCQWAYALLWWAFLRRCWQEAIAGDLGLCSVAAVEPASWLVHDPRRSQCSADQGACDWSYPSEHVVPKSDLHEGGERERVRKCRSMTGKWCHLPRLP